MPSYLKRDNHADGLHLIAYLRHRVEPPGNYNANRKPDTAGVPKSVIPTRSPPHRPHLAGGDQQHADFRAEVYGSLPQARRLQRVG